MINSLDEFLEFHPDRQVIDLEIESQGPDYKSPFIVVRYGKFAILLVRHPAQPDGAG